MFVSDIRPSDAIYSYNSIKLNVLRREMVEADRVNTKSDAKKAIAEMAKDFTLQQYQYFVGRANTGRQETTTFRTGKNFAL